MNKLSEAYVKELLGQYSSQEITFSKFVELLNKGKLNPIDVLKEIEERIERPFVTDRFGDDWKEWALKNLTIEAVVNIAWKQGRKVVLLEREL